MTAKATTKSTPAKPATKAASKKGAGGVTIETTKQTGRKRYVVDAVSLDAAGRPELEKLQKLLLRTMPVPEAGASPKDALRAAFDAAVPRMENAPSGSALEKLWERTHREFLGYGRIDSLMEDPMIEEITCDGPGIPIFIFHREHGAIHTNVVYDDEKELDSFVIRMAQLCNREITYARPMLEATLPDASRLQASLSREVTTRGSSFTIRRFRPDPMTPLDLVKAGTISAQLGAFLWMAIEGKSSMLFVGGTASGKTTTLNALCTFIPQDEKIVSIEDTRELNLPQQNWTAGLTRRATAAAGNADAAQDIDMYKLLETALRQRPDYILVGEVRGAEAVTLFQAMATGHATMSTMHADSPLTAVRRLENPPIGVPRNLMEALGLIIMHRQAPSAGASARRVFEVSEISGIDPETGDLLMRVLFTWNQATDEHEWVGKARTLQRIWGVAGSGRNADAEWERRTALLTELAEAKRLTIAQLMDRIVEDRGLGVE